MYQALHHQGYAVHYKSSLEFIREFDEKTLANQVNFSRDLQIYLDVDFLIIDEVIEGLSQGETCSHLGKEMLFTLINERYQANLATLIISSQNISDFKLNIEARIGKMMENSLVLAMDWPNYGRKK
jgi:hypothetical protein